MGIICGQIVFGIILLLYVDVKDDYTSWRIDLDSTKDVIRNSENNQTGVSELEEDHSKLTKTTSTPNLWNTDTDSYHSGAILD